MRRRIFFEVLINGEFYEFGLFFSVMILILDMPVVAKYSVFDFFDHLFWDFDRNRIDKDKPNVQLVQRVLEYGFLKDWILLTHLYSFDDILQIAMNIRNLDPRAAAFLINISGVSKDDFRCFATKQSMLKHWDF